MRSSPYLTETSVVLKFTVMVIADHEIHDYLTETSVVLK